MVRALLFGTGRWGRARWRCRLQTYRHRCTGFPIFSVGIIGQLVLNILMIKRRLGSSGLLVSPICLGTMTFGSPVEEKQAIKLTHAAIDLGINFIDTANVYEGYDRFLGSSGGTAEEILGKALRDRRDEVVLATKVGSPNGPGPQDVGLSATTIHRSLEASLRRLKTDFIDLYIIHWPDPDTPLEATLNGMESAVRQGKVGAFGVSNHYAWKLCKLLWLADRHGWPKAVSSQIPFSMLKRVFQNDLEFCATHDIGVTPYQALEGGLLSGKYKRGQDVPSGSRMAEKPAWIPQPDDSIFDTLEASESLASELGISLAQYALAWALAQPAMSSLVVGVTKLEQIESAIAASEVKVPEAILERQEAITPPPYRHAAPFNRG
jgi:aryl-alcohol dehydrogenase-like predicted oxidoreductase